MAVAAAGLIIGCLFLSGIGMKFSYMLMTLSGGQLWLALIYTTFAAFILGLSLPTTAVYLTLAIIVAPGLVQMGVPKMAAHMFIFYMGVTSDLTPPTCLSPFAAAAIAGSPPMATAWQAMRLGAVLFIVPFMFVYQPALLMIGPWSQILLAARHRRARRRLPGGGPAGLAAVPRDARRSRPAARRRLPVRHAVGAGRRGGARPARRSPTACRGCAAPRRWPLRPLLRWTSLLGGVALLAVLGAARTHQQNFPLFLRR